MKHYKHFYIAALIIALFSSHLKAQNTAPPFRSELSGSYALGAQVYNSNFLFRPGYAINYTHNYKLNKHINAGIGLSYMRLDDENFTPFYVNVLALRTKKDSEKYIRTQIGYALAHSKAINRMEDYDLKGGVYFKCGFGRTFPINDKIGLSTELSYKYQNARLDYPTYNNTTYTESLDYSFFEFSLGIVLNYRENEN